MRARKEGANDDAETKGEIRDGGNINDRYRLRDMRQKLLYNHHKLHFRRRAYPKSRAATEVRECRPGSAHEKVEVTRAVSVITRIGAASVRRRTGRRMCESIKQLCIESVI